MAFIEGKSNPNLGEMVGSGLASGIDQLLNIKMNQVLQGHERNRVAKAYSGLGLTPEQSQVVANVPEKYQMDILRELSARNQEDQWRKQQMQQPQMQASQQQMQGSAPQSGLQNFMGQRSQQQDFQPQQRIPFQNPQMAWQQQKFQMQLAENQRKEQKSTQQNIERRADKFIDQAVANAGEAEQLKTAVLRAKELIGSGKTRAGVQGLLSSKFTNASPETRELEKIFSELILLRGNMGKGVASRLKLQLAAAAKPSLDMPKSSQLRILDDMLEDSEKTINAVNIIDEIIDANGGEVPKGLNRLATQVYHNRYSGKTGQNAQQAMGQGQGDMSQGGASQGQQANNSYDGSNENMLGTAARLATGIGTRISPHKAFTGLGDIAEMGGSVADYVASAVGKENLGAREAVEKYSPLPSSDSVAKHISDFTKGYTDPKNGFEEAIYNMADFFGSIWQPQRMAGKTVQGLMKLGLSAGKAEKAKNVIMPFSGYMGTKKRLLGQIAAGEGLKQTAAAVGGGPVPQAAAQIAGFLLAGTAGTRKKIELSAKEDFNSSKSKFGGADPKNPNILRVVPIEDTIKNMERLKARNVSGSRTYSKAELEILDDTINGLKSTGGTHVPIQTIIDQTESLNERFKLSTQERFPGEKATPQDTRDLIHSMQDILAEPIAKIGQTSPDLQDAAIDYINGKDKWRALHTMDKATKWMVDNSKHFNTEGMRLHEFVFKMLKNGIGLAGRDIGKAASLFKTKIGRQAYLEAIEAASLGNMSKFKRAYNTLIAIAKREGIQ